MLSIPKFFKIKSFMSFVVRKKENETDETYTNLLDDSRSTNLSISSTSKLTKNLLTLSILPTLYLIFNNLIIFVLLYLRFRWNITYTSDFSTNSSVIANFYDLPKVSPLMYNIYSSITSLIGLFLVSILFSALKQRFKVPEFMENYYKLYVLLSFGLITNFFNFGTVLIPFFFNTEEIDSELRKNLSINLNQLMFLNMIFFSVCFAFYSLFCLSVI